MKCAVATAKNDPLGDYEGLALLRRAFPFLPPDPLDSHHFLLSLPLRNPEELLVQARSILIDHTDSRTADSVNGGNPLHRSGLGLKYSSPEFGRWFHIRSENDNAVPEKGPMDTYSKTELAEQKGRSVPKTQFAEERHSLPQNPGVSWSTEYTYKPEYRVGSAVKNVKSNTLSVMDPGQTQEIAMKDSEGGILHDINIGEYETCLSNIVVEISSCDDNALVGDGAVNLLRERLENKANIVEEFYPESPKSNKINLGAAIGNMIKRIPLRNVRPIMQETKNFGSLGQKRVKSPLPNKCSPTPPRSPLASLSAFSKALSRATPIKNPFKFLGDENHRFEEAKSVISSDNEVNDIRTVATFNKTDSYANYNADNSMNEEMLSHSDARVVQNAEDADIFLLSSSKKISFGNQLHTTSRLVKSDDNAHNSAMHEEFGSISLRSLQAQKDAALHSKENEDDVYPSKSSMVMLDRHYICEDSHVDKAVVVSSTAQNDGALMSDKPDGSSNVREKSDVDVVDSSMPMFVRKELDTNKDGSCTSDSVASEDRHKISYSEKHADSTTEPQLFDLWQRNDLAVADNTEHEAQPSTQISDKTLARTHSRKRKKGSIVDNTQSLAVPSTSCVDGLRRGSRIRSRPLKYWKGERFLYGRIHESLATVIGVKKYDSPQTGKRTLKVKSFVDKKFQNLVELAALD